MCDYHDEAEAAAGVDGDYLEVEEAVSRMEAEQAVVVVAELIEYGVERSLVGISVFPSWVGYPKLLKKCCMYFSYPNPKFKELFKYSGTQHRLQK